MDTTFMRLMENNKISLRIRFRYLVVQRAEDCW